LRKLHQSIGYSEKDANFFAENCRKSQEIVIITLTPGESFTYSKYGPHSEDDYKTTIITYSNHVCTYVMGLYIGTSIKPKKAELQ
jgi:hypothetical protein